MIFTWRNPISIVFLVVLGLMQAFLQASIFHGVGDEKISLRPRDLTDGKEVVSNWLGLSFLCCSD